MERLKRIFSRSKDRNRKIQVFALVGDTGTGKSFRARLITEKYGIDLMIDDGLLIRGQRILAGRSAKREKNKFTAIKRAIFDDPLHAREVMTALEQEKYRSILLIGTSEKMVGRIAERLDLPFPDQIIYIQDVATEDEILQARESRKKRGKHVIPVPVIEVKQDPAHRVIDSFKLFMKRHPIFPWKNEVVEKAVVQPEYSRRGRLSISETALGQMIMHCVEEFAPEVKITRIIVDQGLEGYELEVRIGLPLGIEASDLLSGLQDYIITNVERYTGIHIDCLDLTIDKISKRSKFAKDPVDTDGREEKKHKRRGADVIGPG